MNVPPAVKAARERLGCSLAYLRPHWVTHRCLDGRTYPAGECVLVDPDRAEELAALLADLRPVSS